MAELNNQTLMAAIAKMASLGEQAGFSVEEMIALLNTGVSIDALLDLVCGRLKSDLRNAESEQVKTA